MPCPYDRRLQQCPNFVASGLVKLVEELQRYEQKYGMRSEIFYALIAGTPAEDHPDFLQWAMCYRSYFRTVQAKFPLKELAAYAV